MEQSLQDEAVLRQLGYRQVLYRTWGTFTTVTIAISAMSVLTSISASFSTGLSFGGPVVCIWGWLGVSLCMLCVALGMAELASAYPTSGGMYFWQYKLSGPRVAPFACFLTGWLNLLGQVAAVSAVAFLCSGLITTMAMMASTVNGGTGAAHVTFTPAQDLGIYAGILVLVALLNSTGLRVLTLCTQAGGIFHLAGVLLLVFIVPLMAKEHQPASWVFTWFEHEQAEASGITHPFYIAILGLLLPAYSYTGLDGPAHMSEEVNGAGLGPPKAILSGWAVMFVGGLGMVLALLFSINPATGIAGVLSEDAPAGGNALAQIMYDASVQRFGGPRVGIGLLTIVIIGVFFCAVATMTYVSRILFCYARDKAVPLSWMFVKVDPWTKTPIVAVWGVALAAFCLGLPMLGSATAFNAILSVSTISLMVAYVTPITARISWGWHLFRPGPFSLGVWAYPLGVVSTLWMLAACVIFCLPTALPVDAENLNYAAAAFVGVVVLCTAVFWCPGIGAYRTFKGPQHTADDDGPSKAGALGGGPGLPDASKDVAADGGAGAC